ncbi:MAG: AAA family ATPase [Bacillota bacterium]|uniref:ATP-binding protein n=1 Tax=Virgibacillus TaxID=84406 RepID=UPI001964097A|nr:AAA family ATPase [Virgibacillus sp. AGTR]MCC2251935.1 AAA family ATPase [Virgibacillus sp. AGTR]QRZ16453.1 AAA family ATPase [Virgibacillus sp. AGTR]
MKFEQATIFGFGKWVDDTIDFSNQQVTYIYGENESGKSTLHTFILFMLFGLPPKQREFYRPKTSGKMGGRLTVVDKGVRFTIERFHEVRNGAAVCYTADGNEEEEQWLKERLKGMNYAIYQSIFSFSANDLATITTMKEDDLGDVILGIGMTGSTNLYTVEKQLDSKIGELYKPYGKKPAINQQLSNLQQMQERLDKWKKSEGSYRNKKLEAQQIEKELQALRIDLEQETAKRIKLEKKHHAWPIIQEYQAVMERLQHLPEVLAFPESGRERLEKQKELLLPLKSENAVSHENIRRLSETIHSLEERKVNEVIIQEAKDLLADKASYEAYQQENNRLQVALQKQQLHIEKTLENLNISLNEEDLQNTHLSFHTEKHWKHIKNDLDKLDLEKEQLDIERNQLNKQRTILWNQIDTGRENLYPERTIDEWQHQLKSVKHSEMLQQINHVQNQRSKDWQYKKLMKERKAKYIVLAAISAALICLLVAITIERNLFLVIAMFVLMTGVGQWFWQKKSIAEIDHMLHSEKPQPSNNVTEKECLELESKLEQQQQLKNEIRSLQEQLKTTEISLLQWEEKQFQHMERYQRIENQMKEQHEQYPFLQEINPTYWPEFFHELKNSIRMSKQLQEYRDRITENQEALEKMSDRISMFLSKVNRDGKGKPIKQQYDWIMHIVEENDETIKQLDFNQQLLQETMENQYNLNEKMKTYEQEMAKLFTIAEVNSEEDFYKKAKIVDEKRTLTNSRAKLESQLSALFKATTWQHYTQEDMDADSLRMELEQTKERISNLEEALEKGRQTLADRNAMITSIEMSEEYSDSIHLIEQDKEKLNQLVKKWAVMKTAKELLLRTKRSYRDKYLSEIIEETSLFFAELTGNRYQKVYPPSQDVPFKVERNDGTRFTIKELSQGTIDQLYVSLRLAISSSMSERHALPFMIDDAFVHFDSIRTQRIINILNRIAKQQQVLVFTCKKEMVEASENKSYIHL